MTTTTMTFDEYVAQWDSVVAEIEALNDKLKPLKAQEMTMRKAIADSVAGALGTDWKEGMNTYPMPDGRKLKVNNKITRTVEVSEIEATRAQYTELNDRPVDFDALLRVKYELDKRSYDKLEGPALATVRRMLTTKPAAPEVKLD